MKTVDLLQVVYEHWAKSRDIEEKKILKSSIGSPLPTCLHCVICKSNNLFKSLFLSFFGVCLPLRLQEDCLKMNAFRMSGSWGHLWQGEDFFSHVLRYTFMWKLGQVGQICFLFLWSPQSTFCLYFINLPPQCHWWKVASFFFFLVK